MNLKKLTQQNFLTAYNCKNINNKTMKQDVLKLAIYTKISLCHDCSTSNQACKSLKDKLNETALEIQTKINNGDFYSTEFL